MGDIADWQTDFGYMGETQYYDFVAEAALMPLEKLIEEINDLLEYHKNYCDKKFVSLAKSILTWYGEHNKTITEKQRNALHHFYANAYDNMDRYD